MAQESKDQEILETLDRLSPLGKRKALVRLIRDLERLDRMVDRNQNKLRSLCKKKGLDFASLTELQREKLIDRIIHGE